MESQIAILDGGSQYSKLIDRRIRILGIISDILPFDTPLSKLNKYEGIIISGSPDSISNNSSNKFDYDIFKFDKPILGICYGMQLITDYFNGILSDDVERSDGQYNIHIDTKSLLFKEMNEDEDVLLTHGDSVIKEPVDFKIIAKSKTLDVIYGIELENIYGIQFHPEVNLTSHGDKIFENFVFRICKCNKKYNIADKYFMITQYIKNNVKNKNVLTLVSGGIDSTVCTALLYKTLGKKRVYSLHIDNGFMRKNESKQVKEALKNIGFDINIIDGSKYFYKNIGDKTDPEVIRQIIGNTFIKIMNNELNKLKNKTNYLLAQGTLRPDLIESASNLVSNSANIIKTHHNDSDLVRKLRSEGNIIEPLSEYHKDEIREIGKQLGLPNRLINRHPFPGPGLAIRIICNKYKINYSEINKKLDIFRNKYTKYFFDLLPIRSVGVQGDHRSYNYVCSISSDQDVIDWEDLINIGKDVPKSIKDINRVVYIFDGSFDKIHYTKTYLYKEEIKLVRKADYLAQNLIDDNSKISQMPIILIPLSFNEKNKRSIVIRTIITDDFMTGLVANPDKDLKNLDKIRNEIKKIDGISRICYDLTSKPPGTTEWL